MKNTKSILIAIRIASCQSTIPFLDLPHYFADCDCHMTGHHEHTQYAYYVKANDCPTQHQNPYSLPDLIRDQILDKVLVASDDIALALGDALLEEMKSCLEEGPLSTLKFII